jgi:tetratricopeptide (TPR) repeat protein
MGPVRVVALGILLALLTDPVAADEEQFRPLFKHPVAQAAHRAFRFKKYMQAARLAGRVLEKHRLKEDERAGLLFIRARALLRAGEPMEAVDTFEKLMKQNGTLADHAAWYHGSMLLEILRPPKEAYTKKAIESLRRVPVGSRFGVQARRILVKYLLALGKEEEACRLAAEAVQAYAGRAREAGAMLQLALCRERLAVKVAKESGWPQAREILREVAGQYRELAVLYPHLPSGMLALEHSKRLSDRGIWPRPLDPARLLARARQIASRLRSRRDLYTLKRIKTLLPKSPKDPSRYEVDLLYGVLCARYRWFRTAYRILRRVMKNCPDTELRARANVDVAGLLARRQPRMAVQEYLMLQKRWPESSVAPLALYKAGELARRLKDEDVAKRIFLLCVEKYPASPPAARSRWGLAWMAYRSKKYKEALSWLEFLLASIDLLPDEAAGDLVAEGNIPDDDEEDSDEQKPEEGDDVGMQDEKSEESEGGQDKEEEDSELAREWKVRTPFEIERRRFKERVQYWRARILEQQGNPGKAAAEYRILVNQHPYGYYSLMAWNRLVALGQPRVVQPSDTPAKGKSTPSWKTTWNRLVDKFKEAGKGIPTEKPSHPEVAAALCYLRMGLADEARATLIGLRRENLQRIDRRVASRIWNALGEYSRSHRMAPVSWEGGLPGFPEGELAIDAKLAYPQAFAEHVLGSGRDPAVHPELLFALIRAESGFWVRARSAARALGLTQMVRRTAYATARKIKMKGFRFWKLFEPEIAVKVGSAHLAELLEHFQGYLPLALAAYNAGEKSVSRWVAQRGDLPLDAFIEEIPYAETNRYVRKVISFFAIYRALYSPKAKQPLLLPFRFDEDLVRRAKRNLMARRAAAAQRAAAALEKKEEMKKEAPKGTPKGAAKPAAKDAEKKKPAP